MRRDNAEERQEEENKRVRKRNMKMERPIRPRKIKDDGKRKEKEVITWINAS